MFHCWVARVAPASPSVGCLSVPSVFSSSPPFPANWNQLCNLNSQWVILSTRILTQTWAPHFANPGVTLGTFSGHTQTVLIFEARWPKDCMHNCRLINHSACEWEITDRGAVDVQRCTMIHRYKHRCVVKHYQAQPAPPNLSFASRGIATQAFLCRCKVEPQYWILSDVLK